ncbi:PIN domain-containing protein [Streptomyces sp. NPDC001523]|uniref:PIN domain-containing protein n=1 Tax=Streptomyces sp. NPDC001523 TaxID=3154383 RepID=UPI003327E272
MIVLDTNQFSKVFFPHGPALGMIRKIASWRRRVLAIPEMVAIELVAHHQHEVEQNLKAAHSALVALSGAFNEDLLAPVRKLSAQDAADQYRSALEEVFTILPTPVGAAEEALRREAHRMAPAEQVWSDGKNKVKARGARDTAIWLTLLAAAQTEEEVWFLSYDKDFGSADGFHPALAAEAQARLGESPGRLRLMHQGIQQLLEELAEEFPPPRAEVERIMRGQAVRNAVADHMSHGVDEFLAMLPYVTQEVGAALFQAPKLQVDKVMDTKAYKIGERIWFSARLRWHGERTHTVLGPQTSVWAQKIAYSFDTTVLIARGEEGAASAEVVSTGPLLLKDRQAQAVEDGGRSVLEAFGLRPQPDHGRLHDSAWRLSADDGAWQPYSGPA